MKLSHGEVAKRVGMDRSSISNSLRLLKLPEPIQDLVKEGSISVGHAKAIMAIPDAETQIKVAEEVARGLLSVRETEQRIAGILGGAGRGVRGVPAGTDRSAAPDIDPNVAAAAQRLTRALATKVRIV